LRVLLVVAAADTAFSAPLVVRLRSEGHAVAVVHTGTAALTGSTAADMVLLDLELTDRDALGVCREIRDRTEAGIICCTHYTGESDRVLALQAGADDCLVRPFGADELTARMGAITRRAHLPPSAPETGLIRGLLQLNPRTRQVLLAGQSVALTRKEFDLLLLLAVDPERTLPRRTALEAVWADEPTRAGRTLDTHVSSIRRKLGAKTWIVTVRGVGLRLGHG